MSEEDSFAATIESDVCLGGLQRMKAILVASVKAENWISLTRALGQNYTREALRRGNSRAD
jgi:hypothetical protein